MRIESLARVLGYLLAFFVLVVVGWGSVSIIFPAVPFPRWFAIVAFSVLVVLMALFSATIVIGFAARVRRETIEENWRRSVETRENMCAAIEQFIFFPGYEKGYNKIARMFLLEIFEKKDRLPYESFSALELVSAARECAIAAGQHRVAKGYTNHALVVTTWEISMGIGIHFFLDGWLTEGSSFASFPMSARASEEFFETVLYPHCRAQEVRKTQLDLDETHIAHE